MLKHCATVLAALLVSTTLATGKELQSVGVIVGSLGNPFFVALGKGAEDAAKKINSSAKISVVSSDYDLAKQSNQMDSFVSAGVDMILLDAVDPNAITPAIKRAQAAGVVVVGVDEAAVGEDATVMTDNVKAGAEACNVMATKLGGKGSIVIVNGPQVSSVVARVKGCKETLGKSPEIKILSDDQDAKGSRDGGLNVMQALLTRFPEINAVFAINDPSAIGSSLALRQLNSKDIFITSVDGSPDIEAALKDPTTQIVSSSSQDPYAMAVRGVELGFEIMNGKKPANPIELMPPKVVTPENVKDYVGWSASR